MHKYALDITTNAQQIHFMTNNKNHHHSEVWINSYGRLKILTLSGANFGYKGPILGFKKRKIIRIG